MSSAADYASKAKSSATDAASSATAASTQAAAAAASQSAIATVQVSVERMYRAMRYDIVGPPPEFMTVANFIVGAGPAAMSSS